MTITLTGKQVIESAEALRRIAITVDGRALYHFDVKTKVTLARRLRQLTTITETIDQERSQLMVDHGITGRMDANKQSIDDHRAVAKFNDAYVEVLEAMHTLDCDRLPMAALTLEKNDIPHTLLAALDGLIEFPS